MQGSQDIAVHVGTLHYTCKAVIEAFAGDIHPGDVFAINDPYLGGTHFNDVRIIRPIFVDGEVIAYAQSNGHWADVGGTVPGSFDINAKEHFGEGLRIPPIRIWDQGKYLGDIVRMFASQHARARHDHRRPRRRRPRRRACASARSSGSSRSTARTTIMTAFREVQDYVEILTRAAHRRDARRRLGDRGLPRLRPVRRRGPDPDQGQDDDRGRSVSLRPLGLAPGRRDVPQRRLRQRVLGRDRGHEDVLPGRPAQLRLLPRGAGRPRARGLGRQRALADRGHRLLRRARTRRS